MVDLYVEFYFVCTMVPFHISKWFSLLTIKTIISGLLTMKVKGDRPEIVEGSDR